jgi:hypothetical protein
LRFPKALTARRTSENECSAGSISMLNPRAGIEADLAELMFTQSAHDFVANSEGAGAAGH